MSDHHNKNKLCAVPWKELYLNPEIQYSLCCKEKQSMTVKTDAFQKSIEDHWNGKYIESVRQSFISGKDLSVCDLCWQEEKENKISMRMRKNLRYTGKIEPDIGDLGTPGIKGALISVGNQCQLRCVSCNPSYSRSILKDYDRLGWVESTKTRFNIVDSRRSTVSLNTNAWQQLRQITPDLEWLTITGGEPTMSKDLQDYLKWCCETGHSDHITLVMTTNGVNVRDAWLDLWQRFHRIKLTISVDATGDLERYVRWPTDWEKKSQWIISTKDLFPEISIHSVIHAINLLGLPELVNWTQSHKLFHSLEALTYPDCLSIKHLPENIKKVAQSRLNNISLRPGSTDDLYDRTGYLHNCLESIKSRLEMPQDLSQTKELIDIIKGYDSIRPMRLDSLLPEFVDIL